MNTRITFWTKFHTGVSVHLASIRTDDYDSQRIFKTLTWRVNARAVSRITTADGQDISGTRLGEKLFLRIEMDRASIFGIFARNLKVSRGTCWGDGDFNGRWAWISWRLRGGGMGEPWSDSVGKPQCKKEWVCTWLERCCKYSRIFKDEPLQIFRYIYRNMYRKLLACSFSKYP